MALGLLCGLSTMEKLRTDFFGVEESCWSRAKQLSVRFLGLVLSIICIIVTAIILLQGDGTTSPCPECALLSCVPFPPWASQSEKWWYCDDCGRVTAEIKQDPDPHLQLDCPDGTNIAVGLDSTEVNRDQLEHDLPDYCRQYCPDLDVRFL